MVDPAAGSGRRHSMLYCVVAGEAPRKVRDALARQYEDDPTVRVIVEQRVASRRQRPERRVNLAGGRARIFDRRAVRNPDGLRVADRRTVLGPSFRQLALPRAARGHQEKIVFGSPMPRTAAWGEDVASARLALDHQSGDTRAFESLYELWFDRTYTFMRTVTGHQEEIEEAVNVAFGRLFDRLGAFDPSALSFRVWLGAIVTEIALAAEHEIDGEQAEMRILDRWVGPADLEALSWLRDDELLVLLRQLPSPQREVVALGYIFGLDPQPVADIVGLVDDEVHEMHDRALRFMSGCLTSLSRRPGYSGRLPAVERRRYYPVTTGRKRALVA
jgi:RNA polymerase sigma factor (sigma-70 family)